MEKLKKRIEELETLCVKIATLKLMGEEPTEGVSEQHADDIWDAYSAGRAIGHEEQNKEEDKTENDDWIGWEGGDRPVDEDVIVEVRLADGCNRAGYARNISWYNVLAVGGRRAGRFDKDVVAYRIVKSPKEEGVD
jgi:hypothetical protein